jgi:transcriptional regulator with XRE-family HTH domain
MTEEELREALARLGLTQIDAARLLGVNPRTMRRWIKQDSWMPHSAEMVIHNLLVKQCEKDGTKPPKPPLELRTGKLDRWEEFEVYRAMDSGINTVAKAPRR